MRKISCLMVLFSAFLIFSSDLGAQTASLNGIVMDQTGAVIPNVHVAATELERNLKFETVTSETGRYLITNLPIGTYAVQAEATGFKLYRQTGVELTVDLRAVLNISLEVGAVTEIVEVNAQASRVDVQTATVQQLVDSLRVEDLPLNGRNVYQLATLVPGTGTDGFEINGGRGGTRNTTANVRLDGALNIEQNLATVLPTPPPDAVQEFTIQTSVPSAKYGYAAGVIEIATKSGTNSLHGSLYDFFRNDALDAKNFFSAQKTRKRRNQYGFTVGGPVYLGRLYDGRNKSFFFFSFEQQKEPRTQLTTIYVPTAQQLLGNFSGFSKTIKDPATGQAFSGNQIPVGRLDPLAMNVIKKFVPTSTDPSGIYRYQTPVANNPTQVLVRGDHTMGSDQFMWRSYWSRNSTPASAGSIPYFAGGGTSYTNSAIHSFSYTRILSTNLVNVARFSWNNWHSGQDLGYDEFELSDLQDLGWSQNYYNHTKYFPELNVSGFFSVSSSRARTETGSNTFTWEDDLTWHVGRHNVSAGFSAKKAYQKDDYAALRSMGAYTYNGTFSGSALTDFMLGRPSAFEQQNEQGGQVHAFALGFYVQDSYKVSARLSLDMGLRYDIPFAPVEPRGTVTVFRPGSTEKSKVFVNAPPGLFFYGDPGVSEAGRETPMTLFGPRFGFSYALTADNKTVLRAGYGIFYNYSFTNIEAQYDNKQPWVNRIQLTAPPSTADPWANFAGGNPFPSETLNPNFEFKNASIFSFAPGYTEPNMQQWNLNLQRELANDFLITMAYVGTKGTHLLTRTDKNAALYVPDQSTLQNLNSRRPYYPPLTTIEWIESAYNSSYQSAQFSLDKRFSKSFSVLFSYTFSKSIDWADSLGGFMSLPQDPHNRAAERGPSMYDRTHVSTTSFIYHLPTPFKSINLIRQIAGNWEVNGIWSLASGTPLSITEQTDRALRGLTNRPNKLLDPRLSGDRSKAEKINQYFDIKAYVANAIGEFGNAPRAESQLRGVGKNNIDLGVVKRVPFDEDKKLEFRAEFFNFPNHPPLSNPNTNLDGPNFGKITSAGDGRIIQFALRITF
jgi:hypothetical protein